MKCCDDTDSHGLLQDIQESCEPTMFSLEQLLFAIANDQRSKDETIKKILPMLKEASEAEKINRQALKVKLSATTA
jgi:protein Jumonji